MNPSPSPMAAMACDKSHVVDEPCIDVAYTLSGPGGYQASESPCQIGCLASFVLGCISDGGENACRATGNDDNQNAKGLRLVSGQSRRPIPATDEIRYSWRSMLLDSPCTTMGRRLGGGGGIRPPKYEYALVQTTFCPTDLLARKPLLKLPMSCSTDPCCKEQ